MSIKFVRNGNISCDLIRILKDLDNNNFMFDRGDYGLVLRAVRKGLDLTQVEAGAKLGYSRSWISTRETGVYEIGLKTIFKLIEACS